MWVVRGADIACLAAAAVSMCPAACGGEVVRDGGLDAKVVAASDAGVTVLPGCDRRRCQGCCTREGSCVIGQEQGACGAEGEDCEDCSLSRGYGSFACRSGSCVSGVASFVGRDQCPGCVSIWSEGGYDCYSRIDRRACGGPAAPCVSCKPNEECAALSDGGWGCAPAKKPDACGATTCVGCCVGDVCALGTQDLACGSANGEACVDCTMTGARCQGRHCVL